MKKVYEIITDQTFQHNENSYFASKTNFNQ